MGMNDKQRNHFFDLIKGICILFVIITHYVWLDSERKFFLFPFLVDMAVPIFMIITGRLWSKSIMHKYASPFGGWKIEYLTKKVVGFGIPFLMAFLVEFVAYTIINGFDGTFNLFSMLAGGIGPGSYYFPVLLQLLLIFPIILFVIRKWDYFGLWICFGACFIYEIVKVAYQMNEGCYRLLALRYIFIIAVGVYSAIGKKRIRTRTKVVSFCIGVLFIGLTYYTEYEPKIFTFWTSTCMVSCLYIIPLFSLAYRFGKNLKCWSLEILGKASYSIFLVQMVYYYCADKFVYELVQSKGIRLFINFFVIILVGLLFDYISGRIVKAVNKGLNGLNLRKKLSTIVDKVNA